MNHKIRSALASLRRAASWRNTLRAAGLITALWILWSRQHPDATALFFCGVLIGLPSFVRGSAEL